MDRFEFLKLFFGGLCCLTGQFINNVRDGNLTKIDHIYSCVVSEDKRDWLLVFAKGGKDFCCRGSFQESTFTWSNPELISH